MKHRYHPRNVRHQRRRQLALHRHPVEQRRLVETLHFDHGIDHLARCTKRQMAIGGTTYLPNAEIKLRRRARIERPLLLAGCDPKRGRGEIDIGKFHRTLHLEGAVADEKDARDMGFHHFDRTGEPVG